MPAKAEKNLADRLAGQILLQVESRGEAWYLNPADKKKYYLGQPDYAFSVIKKLSIGISNADLEKIPVGLIDYDDEDNDGDGLKNRLELALNTNPNAADSDGDGYDDKTEIENYYNPLTGERAIIDRDFTEICLGKIFLQVESKGEAWYIDPQKKKRYYLGRPSDALAIMRDLSLGISDDNLSKINSGIISFVSNNSPVLSTPAQNQSENNYVNYNNPASVFTAAAAAIRRGNVSEAKSYFIENAQTALEYTMNFLDAEGMFILGNIMSGAIIKVDGEAEKIYSTEIYFPAGGYKISVDFYLKKQSDNTWKLINL